MRNNTTTEDTIECFVFKPHLKPKGWKLKMGVVGWNGNELYISSLAFGMSSNEALLIQAYDGVSVYVAGGVVLLSEAWIRKELPQRKELCDAIHRRALELRDSPDGISVQE